MCVDAIFYLLDLIGVKVQLGLLHSSLEEACGFGSCKRFNGALKGFDGVLRIGDGHVERAPYFFIVGGRTPFASGSRTFETSLNRLQDCFETVDLMSKLTQCLLDVDRGGSEGVQPCRDPDDTLGCRASTADD